MSDAWRLLDTGVMDAASNMCLDKGVLEARARGLVPSTLRFLMFSPPAVLVGYHQSVEQEVRETYCRQYGIDINRRITGGGAIFFDETQIGWEVIAGRDELPGSVENLYEGLCQGVIEGLRGLGVSASFRPVNDIEVGSRKISGTGGTESNGAFLFQGTLLVDFDVETMVRSLRIPMEKLRDKEIDSIRERVTCLRRVLGSVPETHKVKAALADGLARTLGVEFEPRDLSGWEEDFLEVNRAEFSSDGWVHRIRRPLRENRALYSVRKAPGGLIRTSVLLDDARGIIKYVMITGDFFAFPDTTILDLEAALKNCPVGKAADRIRAFFEKRRPSLPGVAVEDLVRAIEAALRKRDLADLGLSPEEAALVHEVNGALERLDEASVVLLPYCAKWIGCELRYDEDCLECGGCTVGMAYELARRHSMEPVTIVNFEHLMAVLEEMRKSGITAYLGCCCEPFLTKHLEDMEDSGVAGLLINVENTSCYELDQEREGKLGEFTGQTSLNLELLERLFEKGLVGPACADERADGGDAPAIKEGSEGRRALYLDVQGNRL